jgi:xanthine dehydrogenase accessory factor
MKNEKKLPTDGDLFQRLAEMSDKGEDGVLATVIGTELSTPRHTGSKMIVHPDGNVTGSIGGGSSEAHVIEEAQQVFADGCCKRLNLNLAGGLGVCGGHMEIFLEPVLRTTPFLIIGAGHIGRAMLSLGRDLPFHFTIVDDREEFLTDLEGLPKVTTILALPDELAAVMEVHDRGSVLLASRNHTLDGDFLEAVLKAEIRTERTVPFLGVLGSRSKSARILKRLRENPAYIERLDQLQMPVGLDLGAETPAEIALSVFAEAMAVLREVPHLSNDQGELLGIRLHRKRS